MSKKVVDSYTFTPSERAFLLLEQAALAKAQERFHGALAGVLVAHDLDPGSNWAIAQDFSRIERQKGPIKLTNLPQSDPALTPSQGIEGVNGIPSPLN